MKLVGTKQIETERLVLRKLKKEDYNEAYKNWCNNENVAKYTTWLEHKNSDETRELFEMWEKQYEDLTTFRWIIELKETKELIGTIDVPDSSKDTNQFDAFEIGYCLGENYWGKGYGTESLKAVMKYLFEEIGAEVIYARHLSQNPASGKVMKKAGMKHEGTQRGRYVDRYGIRNDILEYSILKKEYLA